MTRTHIIAADGTRFIPATDAARRRNRIIAIVCLIAATPFMIAAFAGIFLAVTQGVTPDLREGDKINYPTNCWVATSNEAPTTRTITCD